MPPTPPIGTLRSSSRFFRPGPPAEIGHADGEVLRFLANRVTGNVLDVGGGMGAYAHALREQGHDVTLAEIDPACLENARERNIPCADMRATPLRSLGKTYGTVILVDVLEHVEDYASFLKDAAACATDKVLVTVPCNDEFERLFAAGLTYNHIAVSDHVNQFTSDDMAALFGGMGIPCTIHRGNPLFPHALLSLLYESMWGTLKGRLALSSLRFFHKRGWLPPLFPSRIFVEARLRR